MNTSVSDNRNLFCNMDVDHQIEFFITKTDEVVQVGRRGKYNEDLEGRIYTMWEGVFDWCHNSVGVRYIKLDTIEVKKDNELEEFKALLNNAEKNVLELYTARKFAMESWKSSEEDEDIHVIYSEVKDIDVQINSAMRNLKRCLKSIASSGKNLEEKGMRYCGSGCGRKLDGTGDYGHDHCLMCRDDHDMCTHALIQDLTARVELLKEENKSLRNTIDYLERNE